MVYRIDAVAGNLADFPVGARTIERVPIESASMARRLLRFPCSLGEIGMLLRDDVRLRDGDVVLANDERVIAVSVNADDVLAIAPRGIGEAADVAHALGNRHIPLQRNGDELVVAYNPVLEELLVKMHIPYVRAPRVLERPFVHAHAPHEHV